MSLSLSLAGLTHRYPGASRPTLDGIDLEVRAGSMLTVVGPSGSGKSTLLAIVAGIERPDGGTVSVGGRDVTARAAASRNVALMLQQPYLFPHMSVGDNVTFALAARGVRRPERVAVADRWLDLVGLGGLAGRRPRHLSGGEQQRVALARALAAEPEVLLLDEPLANLDPAVRGSLQDTIRSLVVQTGVTAVMVTHDLSEAVALGDRTAILLDGVLVAHDLPHRIFNEPASVAAARFVGIDLIIAGPVRDGVLDADGVRLRVDRLRGRSCTSTVAVRPEHLALQAGAAQDNVVPGRVVGAVFRGEYWLCSVETPFGTIGVRHATRPDQGAAVGVHVPSDAVVAVAVDGPEIHST